MASITPDFFPAAAPLEARARLEYLAKSLGGGCLLIGSEGSGKTAVLRSLARRLHAKGTTVVQQMLMGRGERSLLWHWNMSLHTATNRDALISKMWQHAEEGLAVAALEGRRVVLLGDDAEEVPAETQQAIYRLVKLAQWHRVNFTFCLATSPTGHAQLGSLIPLVRLEAKLGSWTKDELASMLNSADSTGGVSFNDEAVDALQVQTDGNIAAALQLARIAALAVSSCGRSDVTRADISAVASEFATARS